ncbi:hypothetical protein PSEUDO8AS_90142 [Pseudomonas sp. 8AS]|nr:hypothetical protein PSEUDO8AS_90142 [Pseudomonas sp. 8AS]
MYHRTSVNPLNRYAHGVFGVHERGDNSKGECDYCAAGPNPGGHAEMRAGLDRYFPARYFRRWL